MTELPLADPAFNRVDETKISQLLATDRDPHDLIAEGLGPKLAPAFREYRQRWESATRFEREFDFPLHMDLELGFSCNLRCPMCPHSLPIKDRRRWGDNRVRMETEVAKRLLEQAKALGTVSVGFNYISEPLIQPGFVELLRHARALGFLDVMFNSNALALSEEMAEAILDAEPTRAMFSLDAFSPETYAQVRVGSDFPRVLANIHRFLELKRARDQRLPVTRVSFVRLSENEHELESFLSYWKEHVDFFCVQEYNNPYEGELFSERESLRAKGCVKQTTFRCSAPWQRLTVRGNGDVLPCCSFYAVDLALGNVAEQSLEEIWSGQRFRDLRQLHKEGRYRDEPVCKTCAEKTTVIADQEQA